MERQFEAQVLSQLSVSFLLFLLVITVPILLNGGWVYFLTYFFAQDFI